MLCGPVSDGFGAFESLVRVSKVLLWMLVELKESCEGLTHFILSVRSKLNDVGLNIRDKIFVA